MKIINRCSISAIIVLLLIIFSSCIKQKDRYEAKQTVNNLTFSLSSNKYPIPKGDAKFILTIKDQTGKAMRPEFVDLRFFMSEESAGVIIPGFRTPAVTRDDGYYANVTFQAEGEWNVEITARQIGANMSMSIAKFSFKVI